MNRKLPTVLITIGLSTCVANAAWAIVEHAPNVLLELWHKAPHFTIFTVGVLIASAGFTLENIQTNRRRRAPDQV